MRTMRTSLLVMTAALFVLLDTSCASERPPINRVQPNALEKTFFVGQSLADPSDNPEFYYRPTIVDVDYGAGQDGLFTASYAQTVARVNFEITEDLLVARLTYERVADSSGNGSPTDNKGQIVAAFKILSHFDIRRSYNPQTGENLNVVEENTSDRPWYDREFMRVDWSQNQVTTAYQLDTLAALKAYSDNAIEYEPASYYVEDPQNADAPVFSPDDGYFDVTNKVFAKPQMIDTPYGSFPACFFNADFYSGSGPISDCNPVELKVRLSFRRLEDSDYEPVDWDGQRMQMFGAFTTGTVSPDRFGYDRNLGVVDSKWYRFASRHNIWQQSHTHDAAGKLSVCTSDADCDGVRGSHCDPFRAACTLPYRDRETRPVAYHYGPDSDPTLFDTVSKVAADWDSALRHAVQTARYSECVHEAGGVKSADAASDCAREYPVGMEETLNAVEPILVLCHNPVAQGDAAACGKPGALARVGDLRYHMTNIIQSPQVPSPWGIMVDANDPLTGEVVSASVNVWNAVTDLATRRTVDLMRWYLGELSSDDVVQGNYVGTTNVVASPTSAPSWRGATPMSSKEIQARLGGMDQSLATTARAINTAMPSSGNARAVVDWALSNTRANFGDDILGHGNAPILARFDSLKGSPVESDLVTESYRSLVGLDASTPLDQNTLELASPLRGGFWQNRSALERQRQLLLAQAGSCVLEGAEPSGAIELAQKLLKKFPVVDENPNTVAVELSAGALTARNAQWSDYIRKHLTRGVLAHEMGHSMGLRHVFTSSFDALNYRPQYWQLRTRDKAEATRCLQPTTDGSSCIGPRYYDPVTDAEREGMLTTWQQTSVMDYPGEITQDMLNIGVYDRAALRFIYGNVTDIWNDPAVQCSISGTGAPVCSSPAASLIQGQLDGFGGITGAWYGGVRNATHYSQLDQKLNLIRDCHPADSSPPPNWNEAEEGVYDPILDGHIVNGTTCATVPTDYVQYQDLIAVNGFDGAVRQVDASGRLRHPYMFGSDEYADIGNVAVYRDDNGGDAFELASFWINEYEDRHVFDDYRRGRSTFTYSGAFMRQFTRYHEKMKEMGKAFGLVHDIFAGFPEITDGDSGDGLSRPHALATSLTFDHFARILTRPASGDHFIDTATDALGHSVLRSNDQAYVMDQPGATNLVLPDGTMDPGISPMLGAHPLHNALDGSKGYYATQYDLWVGSYYEKTQAMDMLADSVDRFISQSRDDFYDGRYRNVSFATLYPEGVRRLIATSLTQDADLLGWRIPTANGKLSIQPGSKLPKAPLGFRVWWPEAGPTMCWPAPGQLGCGDHATGDQNGTIPAESMAIDPEVGFEVQKFITLYSFIYTPESWKRDWVDLMRIFQQGQDPDPAFNSGESITFRDPVTNESYIAHSYGKETFDDRDVERGVGARVLDWANTLAAKAYQVSSTDSVTGELTYATYADDSSCPVGITHCAGQAIQTDAVFASRLRNYKTVIDFIRRISAQLGFYGPSWRGVAR
jgi:hypothetical protein